jgi:uroporphyrinogen decarboxylase
MGNVPTVLFSSGTREEMEHAIRDCIKKAAEGSGYILSSGCEIPLDSTQDRIEHYFSYARQYGQQFMSSLKGRRPELFQD